MPMIPLIDVENAYFVWWHFMMDGEPDMDRNNRSRYAYEEFFRFIGQEVTWGKWPRVYDMSDEGASRVHMLKNSPHTDTILKAYFAKHPEKWPK